MHWLEFLAWTLMGGGFLTIIVGGWLQAKSQLEQNDEFLKTLGQPQLNRRIDEDGKPPEA